MLTRPGGTPGAPLQRLTTRPTGASSQTPWGVGPTLTAPTTPRGQRPNALGLLDQATGYSPLTRFSLDARA